MTAEEFIIDELLPWLRINRIAQEALKLITESGKK